MSKLQWGMIGGGEGSQIGPAHRMSAVIDGLYDFAAGALDADPERGRAFARSLGIAEDRAYGDWREMLDGEKDRDGRLDLVTVATPNATHYEITKAFLEAGFHVLCEKPMTMTVEEGEAIVEIARRSGRVCAVNYGYSGYPMVRHMRAMVRDGELGAIRVVKAEFVFGFHADADDADNPRIRWRYDPSQAGKSSVFADCGIHALHLATFVTGQSVTELSADFASTVASRDLEDDAAVAFRLSGGGVGRLWASAVAVGHMHGLSLRVFGEKGGLRWSQEWPNQLFWTPLNEPTRTLERGGDGLSADAARANRITVGHAEGMPLAFANIYRDLAEIIDATKRGSDPDPLALAVPLAEDGLASVAAIDAAVRSAKQGGGWTKLGPG